MKKHETKQQQGHLIRQTINGTRTVLMLKSISIVCDRYIILYIYCNVSFYADLFTFIKVLTEVLHMNISMGQLQRKCRRQLTS